MAKSNAERSAKSNAKDAAMGAEDLRLKAFPGTAAALKTLMERHGHTLKGEAISTMLLNLAAMPELSAAAFSPIRHEIRISENVAREFVNESRREIARNPGDEIVEPA